MKRIFKDDQLQQQLDEDGYVRIRFLKEKEMERLETFYANTPFEEPDSGFFSTMHIYDPDYRKKVDQEIKEVMTHHINDLMVDHRILFANFLYKKPASDSLVGIHQDWTYVDEAQHASVNIWIPFINVGAKNGGLAVLKGSHKLTTPVRYTPYELPEYQKIFEAIERRCEILNVKRGEAIVYYSNLLHYSTANRENKGRLSINMVVIPKAAQPIHYHKKNAGVKKYLIDSNFYLTCRLFEEPVGYSVDHDFKYNAECFTYEDLLELKKL